MLDDSHEYYSSDDGGDPAASATTAHDPVADPEEWQDYNSEFLLTLWHQLQDTVAGLGVYVLDACTFSDFAGFCFDHSSGRKPPC